jgi:hypothetical protein
VWFLETQNSVVQWWWFISLVSMVNIALWFYIKKYFYSAVSWREFFTSRLHPKLLIFYSAFYVFGCAFRSFVPKADVQRICLWDGWVSSVFLGRTVATVAELAFVMQFAIILNALSKMTHSRLVERLSLVIVPLIFLAELFSWYAVISTNYFGNMIEESLWGMTFTLVGVCFFHLAFHTVAKVRPLFWAGVFFCLCYVFFMFKIDVPMYYHRWLTDLATQKEFLSFWDGLRDLNTRWVVTTQPRDWENEMLWMGLYFSFAVWISLALCLFPLKYTYYIPLEQQMDELVTHYRRNPLMRLVLRLYQGKKLNTQM